MRWTHFLSFIYGDIYENKTFHVGCISNLTAGNRYIRSKINNEYNKPTLYKKYNKTNLDYILDGAGISFD